MIKPRARKGKGNRWVRPAFSTMASKAAKVLEAIAPR